MFRNLVSGLGICFALTACGNVRFVKPDWSEVGKVEALKTCDKYKAIDETAYKHCREEYTKAYDEMKANEKKAQELAASASDG
jgi:hypothetical protein